MLTPQQFAQRANIRFADNEFQNITEASFRDFAEDARQTFVAQGPPNVPFYDEGTEYHLNDLIQYTYGPTQQFVAQRSGLLPPPSSPIGDDTWRLSTAVTLEYATSQYILASELLALRGRFKAQRLYIVFNRVDASNGLLDELRIRALSTDRLEPTGWLMQEPPVLVNYDLATDTTTAFEQGGGPGGAVEWTQGSAYKKGQFVTYTESVYLVRLDIQVSNAAPAGYPAGFKLVGGGSIGGAPQWAQGARDGLTFVSDLGQVYLVLRAVSSQQPQPRPALDATNYLLLVGKDYVDNAVQLPGVLVRQNVVVNALAPVIYTGASLADAGDALTAKGGGGVYAFIDIYRQPAILARNITLPTGTVVNGNNYIIRLDGKTISYNQAGRFFNFAAESGTMQCKFPSDQNPTEFVGGRFGSVLHIAPPNALVLHTNVLYNDAPDFVRFSGGGTFLLNGISADPLPGQIAADGTTVRRSDSVAGPAGKWPSFTSPVSDLGSQLYKATAPQYIRTADVRYTTNGGASYSAAVAAQRAGDVFSLAAPAGSPIGQLGWQVGPGYGRAPSDTLFNAVAFALPDVLRFYAGAETHIDVNGKSWQPLPASQPRFDYNGAGYPPLATVDAELYNIVFYTGSDFSINLPVANGNYRLGLVFSEPYGPLRGARTFDVRLDASGPLILANVNTYTAGSNIASYASQAIISATGGNGITLSLASTGSGPPILQCITLTTA
ncbi:malectin domain-containing carbohydrate-binding protein [Hymenobacter sp. H14-R3]|uniref:malectin domain-containing carbohydrate-binding protein n=1 Tax=Hymenobacter sp. H14-R3 TaxID=3046308 RepID=UPI0024B94A6A|nr:malectin domain-containing carbohydrate-binding protein [Hymenobacter sp. H14-R3]MDJ0367300.1 malectin domain-containing carbohydrate-binding protein [Hymenobacter sp. H14-R3]